jgi:hypothetical protein
MIMEIGELWIYWWWMHILEWMYARQYLWVRLAINVGGKSFLKKIQNSSGHIPEQSSTQTRVVMWIIFGSSWTMYVIEEPF